MPQARPGRDIRDGDAVVAALRAGQLPVEA